MNASDRMDGVAFVASREDFASGVTCGAPSEGALSTGLCRSHTTVQHQAVRETARASLLRRRLHTGRSGRHQRL